MSAAVKQFWTAVLDKHPSIPRDTIYQTWYFGDSAEMARELANLVLARRKIGTASLKAMNDLQPEMKPTVGVFSVVTDFEGLPICVVQTINVAEVPFREVREDFAAAEGEGDLSLAYWRRVHTEYFAKEAASNNLKFDEDSIICCERFKLVFAG